ncbi:neuromedin U [Terriglobus sp. RCC_193]|uniref:neuromedin U n=1 Tax=Terriglobus sp. RCC_193 TaxID=3239218 RepID=UPI003524F852
MHKSILHLPFVALVSACLLPGLAAAQQTQTEEAHSTENLQKATQNPVASMISVPFQNNSNFGIGPYGRIQNVLNIQPVIPVKVTPDLNLIVRWIAPIVYQPAPGTANLQVYGINEDTPAYFAAVDVQQHAAIGGLGDMAPTFFLTSAKAHKMIFATGPMFVLPTGTSRVLGQGKFSMGPSILTLVQPGHWTVGALISNVWSVAGDSSRSDVNQMSFQYFVNYNLKKGWALSTGPIISANWKGSSGNVWTVPIGGGVGRVMRLGYQPANIGVQFYRNAVYPTGGSPWSMRLSVSLLFPKMPKPAAK